MPPNRPRRLALGPLIPRQPQHLTSTSSSRPLSAPFYAGPSPDAGPFVRVGDQVEAGQTVCIIEAMKLMNEIEADIGGEVARVMVENGQPVELRRTAFCRRDGEIPRREINRKSGAGFSLRVLGLART